MSSNWVPCIPMECTESFKHGTFDFQAGHTYYVVEKTADSVVLEGNDESWGKCTMTFEEFNLHIQAHRIRPTL